MTPRLLLVGGGHAHLFVLEALAQGGHAAEVTLVSPSRRQTYSGMVPGVISGRYAVPEALIDLEPLAARANVTLRLGSVSGLDPDAQVATLADGTEVPFDLCSVAVGSNPAGLEAPGVATRALVAKPIDSALAIVPALGDAVTAGAARVVIVGGGAAGVELACAAAARLRRLGVTRPDVALLTNQPTLIVDMPGKLGYRAAAMCHRVGVSVRYRATVVSVDGSGVQLQEGGRLAADVLIWAAGAAAVPWLSQSGLTCDRAGFPVVDAMLRSVSHPHLFVAGDAATLREHPRTPKSGVMAVREGPILAGNLRRVLAGAVPDRAFTPQARTLALLASGDGEALLSHGAIVTEGRAEMWLKDVIDRRFIRRFTVAGQGAG
jgi:selenide,water dikinase